MLCIEHYCIASHAASVRLRFWLNAVFLHYFCASALLRPPKEDTIYDEYRVDPLDKASDAAIDYAANEASDFSGLLSIHRHPFIQLAIRLSVRPPVNTPVFVSLYRSACLSACLHPYTDD